MTILKKNKKIKKNKENMWGKLRLDYQSAQYWKNKFDKDNFKKQTIRGNIAAKQKLYRRNTVAIYIVFLKKKTTKLNSQPT
jgi:hypothetical protein